MKLIDVTNVNEALVEGYYLLREVGQTQETRNGPVWVAPYPVITRYRRPWERVLFHPQRDANPFFHLFEALWMLAGHNDATWLDQFVGDFSSRFGEPDGHMHGAYGHRWRHWPCEGTFAGIDQLEEAIGLLKANPNDRRVVIQMWNPQTDLNADKRDIPCNLSLTPRVNNGRLDIVVDCRSNDMIWGAYGANAVHFSMLQEYLAAMIGVPMGYYYQISLNFHAYKDIFEKLSGANGQWNYNRYDGRSWNGEVCRAPLVTQPNKFDEDLKHFFDDVDGYHNSFFQVVARPLLVAHRVWKAGDRPRARGLVGALHPSIDWVAAAKAWMDRRPDKAKQ